MYWLSRVDWTPWSHNMNQVQFHEDRVFHQEPALLNLGDCYALNIILLAAKLHREKKENEERRLPERRHHNLYLNERILPHRSTITGIKAWFNCHTRKYNWTVSTHGLPYPQLTQCWLKGRLTTPWSAVKCKYPKHYSIIPCEKGIQASALPKHRPLRPL